MSKVAKTWLSMRSLSPGRNGGTGRTKRWSARGSMGLHFASLQIFEELETVDRVCLSDSRWKGPKRMSRSIQSVREAFVLLYRSYAATNVSCFDCFIGRI